MDCRARRAVLVASLLVLLALGAACSSGAPRTASVDGVAIPASDIDAEVAALEADPELRAAWLSNAAGLYRTAERVYPESLPTMVLSVRIIDEVVAREVAARGLEPGELDRRGAERIYEELYGTLGDDVPGFRERQVAVLVDRLVLSNALAVERPPAEVTEAEVQAAYAEIAGGLAGGKPIVCASIILLAPEDPEVAADPNREDPGALAEAQAAEARVRGGEDFERVAIDVSDDSSGPEAGGSIGCQPVPDPPTTPYERALATQPVGEIGSPVRDVSGYYLFLIRSRGLVPLEEVRYDLEDLLERQRSQQFPGDLAPWLVDLVGAHTIEVGGGWGTWDPESATVVPPNAA